MKKFLIIALVVLITLSFVGCDKSIIVNSTNKGNTEEKIKYREDQVLFLASDRCDNDDDSHIINYYNYKGDLLSQSDSYIGYYAENGLAVAYDQSTGLVGYVDKDGVYQIEPIYEDAAPFSKDGIAMVEKKIENTDDMYGYDYKVGYINSKGEEIIPCIYDKATSFFDCGYAIAKREEYTYDDSGIAISGKLIYYILDKKGNEIAKKENVYENTDKEYLFMPSSGDNAIIAVFEDYYLCTMGIYDYSGNELYVDEIQNSYAGKDGIYRQLVKMDEEVGQEIIATEKFNGKEFVDIKESLGYNLYSKRVATTQSGYGYGIEVDGETVIPFEYDQISTCGDYFVGIKYTGSPKYLNQTIDIYDKNYNKTAENIGYAFRDRENLCELPNGYFQIVVENSDYEDGVYGIIDYTGKIIVEPIYGNVPVVNSYEGTGIFTMH